MSKTADGVDAKVGMPVFVLWQSEQLCQPALPVSVSSGLIIGFWHGSIDCDGSALWVVVNTAEELLGRYVKEKDYWPLRSCYSTRRAALTVALARGGAEVARIERELEGCE